MPHVDEPPELTQFLLTCQSAARRLLEPAQIIGGRDRNLPIIGPWQTVGNPASPWRRSSNATALPAGRGAHPRGPAPEQPGRAPRPRRVAAGRRGARGAGGDRAAVSRRPRCSASTCRASAPARRAEAQDVTYLRFAFCGTRGRAEPGRALDHGIVRTLWLTPDEIRASRARHRSPLLLRCVEDYLAGPALSAGRCCTPTPTCSIEPATQVPEHARTTDDARRGRPERRRRLRRHAPGCSSSRATRSSASS